MKDMTHMIVSLGWIVYAIIVGIMAVLSGYQSNLLWASIIVAIVGNSAHMVALSYSQGKIDVASSQTATQVKP